MLFCYKRDWNLRSDLYQMFSCTSCVRVNLCKVLGIFLICISFHWLSYFIKFLQWIIVCNIYILYTPNQCIRYVFHNLLQNLHIVLVFDSLRCKHNACMYNLLPGTPERGYIGHRRAMLTSGQSLINILFPKNFSRTFITKTRAKNFEIYFDTIFQKISRIFQYYVHFTRNSYFLIIVPHIFWVRIFI